MSLQPRVPIMPQPTAVPAMLPSRIRPPTRAMVSRGNLPEPGYGQVEGQPTVRDGRFGLWAYGAAGCTVIQ